jgi:hypothetical protein
MLASRAFADGFAPSWHILDTRAHGFFIRLLDRGRHATITLMTWRLAHWCDGPPRISHHYLWCRPLLGQPSHGRARK